jgi:bifunctional non-homologous end joining protein LigD
VSDPNVPRQILQRFDTVSITHAAKVLYPDAGITKDDVIRYYDRIASRILPFLKDRPLSVVRYPDGIQRERFFSKNAPAGTPEWVAISVQPAETTGKDVRYVVANDRDTLLWLANLSALELHISLSRSPAIDEPDFALFDFDPEPPARFPEAAKAALRLREKLEEIGLVGYVKTSGKKGVHVVVPLAPGHTYARTRDFVHALGRSLAEESPLFVSEVSRSREPGTVFFDYLQNAKGKTMVCPYSLRGTPHATVSTPITWDELAGGASPDAFTLHTVPGRGDPWESILENRQKLPDVELRAARPSRGSPETVDPLREYHERRDFEKTSEPAGGVAPNAGGDRFVVHEHHATRLHYDFRLEHAGVLKSWAVPKGIPEHPGIRHLAIETEDHPLEYIGFTGTIPKGEYGGGTVSIWDAGTYETKAWEPEKIEIYLHGQRLQGRYVLIRFKKAEEGGWLLFKATS